MASGTVTKWKHTPNEVWLHFAITTKEGQDFDLSSKLWEFMHNSLRNWFDFAIISAPQTNKIWASDTLNLNSAFGLVARCRLYQGTVRGVKGSPLVWGRDISKMPQQETCIIGKSDGMMVVMK